jgi:predicted transcriptional regulator
MILQGEKTIELRRRAPRRSTEFWLALYATTPERAVIGIVKAREVIVATPEDLWERVEDACGLGRDEYRRYYEGSSRAVGIRLEDPCSFSNPVSLDRLRNLWPGFHPPRSFAYLSDDQIQEVWGHAGLCCVHGVSR